MFGGTARSVADIGDQSSAPPAASSASMPMLSNTPHLNRLPCPECTANTYLTRIMPREPDHIVRMFECSECDHKVEEIVNQSR